MKPALRHLLKSSQVPWTLRNGVRLFSRSSSLSYGGHDFEKSYGYQSVRSSNNFDPKAALVDMRSDTITQPTKEMREAMANAIVGDDVYLEDPTVLQLEKKAAKMFGMEASLFVPSGTMGNLISVLTHCKTRGSEVILGDKSHIFRYEQGGVAQFGGVHVRTIPNLPDGSLAISDIIAATRSDDVHFPRTAALCLENTHNICGGKVLSLSFLDQVTKIAKDMGIPAIHMDGARIFNASVALKVPVSRLLQGIDSISACLSKGLCAPVGSLIAGSDKFIYGARRLRKALGGGMRQVGHIAAAGLISLECMVDRLEVDHQRARRLAQAIADLQCPFFTVDVEGVHSNLVMIDLKSPDRLTPLQFCQRLVSVTEAEKKACGSHSAYVRFLPFSDTVARAVTNNNLSDEDIELVVAKLQFVSKELEN